MRIAAPQLRTCPIRLITFFHCSASTWRHVGRPKRKGRNGRPPSNIGFPEIFSTGPPLPANPPTSESVSALVSANPLLTKQMPAAQFDVPLFHQKQTLPGTIGTSAKGR